MLKADEIRAQMAELQKQLANAEAEEQRALQHSATKSLVAVVAAFKEAHGKLLSAGVLGEAFANIPQQALPREAVIARRGDLSESEVVAAKKAGRDAIAKL